MVVDRYFAVLQRMIVDYFDFATKPAAARPTIGLAGEGKSVAAIFSKPQLAHHDRFRRLMLETLVCICTRYNALYMFSLDRSTWDALLGYFLAFRSRQADFHMQFYRLITTGFRLGVESIVLDIVLYRNLIGEMWDAVQERSREAILISKDKSTQNELFHHIVGRMLTFLESIEGNSHVYPVMNSQFSVNLAWKKLREFRNPAGQTEAEKIQLLQVISRPADSRRASDIPQRLVYKSSTMLPGLAIPLPHSEQRSGDKMFGEGKRATDRQRTERKKK